jgi:uncharacterized protein YndB with AHSA1/START domain
MKQQANGSSMERRVGDAAVKAKTGRTRAQWFALLDRAGAAKLDHRGIVAILTAKMPHVYGWWQQSVAVAYEQARGLRVPHQKANGFEVSASKTIPVPVSKLFAAWTDDALRSRWLQDAPLVVHKATPPKTLRATWQGAKAVSVYFQPKDGRKAQVAVQHGKLPDAKAAERMQKFWRQRLTALAESLTA